MTPSPFTSLPMLVADLADEGARDFLHGVALAGQVAYVPLLVAPVDRSLHALEVYAPDSTDPLHLLADPVGPPTIEGFPLRLRLREEEDSSKSPCEPVDSVDGTHTTQNGGEGVARESATLRARHKSVHKLSVRHTHDLEGEPEKKTPSDVIGRSIAGGKLLIESLIGSGGVGAVYRAQHRDLRIPVAVKVLHENHQADQDFGRRFHAEALAASRLDHPNVTRVLDFGQEPDGLLYLAMEYLDGVSLRALLDREKRFGTDRIVKIFSQVCAGLAHAHARSLVHKDVKPENLVILQSAEDDDGVPVEVVKVCDFGIAQEIGEQTRRFQGTPEYMSPEQCVAEDLDARSDVYSCGIVLYELATGDVPFTNAEVGRIIWGHLHEVPIPPSERAAVDPRLEKIILRAMAKDKDARYASMRELRTALRDLLEKPPLAMSTQMPRVDVPISAPSPTATTSTRGRSRAPSPSDDPSSPGSPGWLVHHTNYDDLGATSAPAPAPVLVEEEVSTPERSELEVDPTAFVRRLVGTTEPRAFAELVRPLEKTIRDLVESLQVETLWRLASTLDVLATEGPEVEGSRAAMSKALLRILRDPSTLAPIAQRVLAVGDPAGERLLLAAGSFGAHALYSARVRLTEPEARVRFTTALRALGPAAMPILRGGLERLADRLSTPNAIHVAEDLLVSLSGITSLSAVDDEAVGALVAIYARCDSPDLVCAALAVLPTFWRERSRPIILGWVEHPDPRMSMAALRALGVLGISDEHTPKRIANILHHSQDVSVQLAAIRVMVQSRGDARRIGAHLLERRLRIVLPPKTPDEEILAVALTRALFAITEDRKIAEEAFNDVARAWPKDLQDRALAEN